MKASVASAFPAYSYKHEGLADCPYLDIDGHVTTGIGFLVDTEATFRALPWRWGSRFAKPSEVKSEFAKVKGMLKGLPLDVYRQKTLIRLRSVDIGHEFARRASVFEAYARQHVPWDSMCADAQMCVLSILWGAGSFQSYPSLVKALQTLDYAAALPHVTMAGNPGRTADQTTLMESAARGGDPEVIHGNVRIPSMPRPTDDSLEASTPKGKAPSTDGAFLVAVGALLVSLSRRRL